MILAQGPAFPVDFTLQFCNKLFYALSSLS